MAAKIPVTVISGFLGSGKTTLVRHLLENANVQRLAVIVNEFGELGIDKELLSTCSDCPDDKLVELTNGCLCCTVQEEFLPTMLDLLERREDIDRIIIETSGLALPKPLVTAFRWPEIRTGATVDGVLTVVDCAAVAAGTFADDVDAVNAQREADDNLDHESELEELFEDQLACADLVILNKTDLVDKTQLQQVQEFVRARLPRAVKQVQSQHGTLAPEILLGFNAAAEEDLAARPSHHDGDHDGHDHDHHHDDEVASIQLVWERSFESRSLQTALERLATDLELYRVKGFVNVANKPMRMALQGVGQRFDSFFDRPWHPDEPRRTSLVLIGKDLDEPAIRRQLEACER
ncbi:MAG: cobalamin biosynthesis protein CobW [Cyanobacteria bacterium P01_G01_bin.4]